MGAPTPSAQQFSDAITNVTQGIHSGVPPSVLPRNQLSFAVNIATRGGYAQNRPPWLKLVCEYPDVDTQVAATRSIFQGAAAYESFDNNPSCLVASIGGRLYRYVITGRRARVQDITPTGDAGNDPSLLQAWLAQGQDFLVVNDGQSRPLVFDGASTRRLPAGTWLPVGRQIHYSNGRFIVAVPSEPGGEAFAYIASDLVYGASGTALYGYRDSILRTTDNEAILAGRPFGVPLNSGPITSLFSVAVPDTSLGQGPLQVGTVSAVYSVDLPLDATLWTTTAQPIQVVALPNSGPTGFYAVTTINGDAWYRSPDGIRSFVVARRDFNTWVQTDLSQELLRVLPYDTSSLLDHASCVNFDNRFLCTCSPYDTRGQGIAHRGLVSLDFDNISSITSRSQPAYDGLWTGVHVLQVLKARVHSTERCFMFALDCEGNVCLYEIGRDTDGWFDSDGTNKVATQCWIESRALLGSEEDPRDVKLKRMQAGDLWLTQLAGVDTGQIEFTASYISDQQPCWTEWQSFTFCAPACAPPAECVQPVTVQSQYATFLRLPQPADDCSRVTGRPYRTGYSFQVKLAWEGHAELRRLLLWATPQVENLNVACNSVNDCAVLQCCTDDLFAYAIESCDVPPCDVVITVQPTVSFGDTVEWDDPDFGGADAPTFDTDEGEVVHVPDPNI